jgi:hypothetical protein
MVAELSPTKVDHNALKFNQAIVITVLLLSFLFDAALVPGILGFAMLVAAAITKPLFIGMYRLVVRQRLIQPDLVNDHSEPHAFAQALGGVVLLLAGISFFLGLDLIGWVFSWVVIALASLNLFGGYCLGCALYYWLNRIGISRFSKSPPPGTRPGRRPSGGRVDGI